MKDIKLPSGVIQPQSPWNASTILDPHFNTLNYLLLPEVFSSGPRRTYIDNNQFWNDILEEKLRAHRTILLKISTYLSGFLVLLDSITYIKPSGREMKLFTISITVSITPRSRL